MYKQGGVRSGFSVRKAFWEFDDDSPWSSWCHLPDVEEAGASWESGCTGLTCKGWIYSAGLEAEIVRKVLELTDSYLVFLPVATISEGASRR